MTPERDFIVPEVVAFADGHAVVTLDVRTIGHIPSLTPAQAARLAARLAICAERAREMDIQPAVTG